MPPCTAAKARPCRPRALRDGFTLLEDGRALLHGSGPTDRRTNTDSHWHLDKQCRLNVDCVNHLPRAIAELSTDRLKLT